MGKILHASLSSKMRTRMYWFSILSVWDTNFVRKGGCKSFLFGPNVARGCENAKVADWNDGNLSMKSHRSIFASLSCCAGKRGALSWAKQNGWVWWVFYSVPRTGHPTWWSDLWTTFKVQRDPENSNRGYWEEVFNPRNGRATKVKPKPKLIAGSAACLRGPRRWNGPKRI